MVADAMLKRLADLIIDAHASRRLGMIRWIVEHPELDHPTATGRAIFDLGVNRGKGDPVVSVAWQPAPEKIHIPTEGDANP
jgi:hypothetical protein